MAFQSGSVTGFAGATGLLQKLLDFILGTEVTDEVIDNTPNGVLVSFSGNLAHSPIGLGRLIVEYTVGAVTYTATDDGSGSIVDDATGGSLTSGTITYATGAWELEFSTAPDNATDIEADYIYGEEGQDWREEVNRNTRSNYAPDYDEPFGSDCKECILSNTGLSGQEAVNIGLREWKYPAGGGHGWDMNGYIYLPVADHDWNFNWIDHGQNIYDVDWEHFTRHPVLPLIDDTMYYWFYANQQRIVVVVKVQSNYESAYLGFGRRFGNPADYQYPLVIIGSTFGNDIYSSTNNMRQFCIYPYRYNDYYSCYVIEPSGEYLTCRGYSVYDCTIFLPMNDFILTGVCDPDELDRTLMTPVYVCGYQAGREQTYMDLDGVFHLMGSGVQSEDVLNFDGKSYRAFQNCHRTDYYQFMGVEEGVAVSTTTTTSTTSTSTTSTTTTSTTSTSTTTTTTTT